MAIYPGFNSGSNNKNYKMTKEIKLRFDALETQLQTLKNKCESKLLPENTYKYHCPECGNPFVLNENQNQRRRDKNRTFYCASGHSIIFPA